MSDESIAPRNPFADVAPALADYSDRVLFGDVWKRAGLSSRDRSLITVASLISLYRTNELPFHFKRALENGVTRDELVESRNHAERMRSAVVNRNPWRYYRIDVRPSPMPLLEDQ